MEPSSAQERPVIVQRTAYGKVRQCNNCFKGLLGMPFFTIFTIQINQSQRQDKTRQGKIQPQDKMTHDDTRKVTTRTNTRQI